MPKNYMEEVVNYWTPKILEEYSNICKCNKCIDDIKAITLNEMKPIYVSTDRGHFYAKINELSLQIKSEVKQEHVKAIEIVKDKPHH